MKKNLKKSVKLFVVFIVCVISIIGITEVTNSLLWGFLGMAGVIFLLVCLANFRCSKAARVMLIAMFSIVTTICFMVYVRDSLAVLFLFPVALVTALTILHNKFVAPWCRG